MRHYITKVQQARQMMAIRLGLEGAFKMNAQSSLRVKKFHIKYLAEARPGDPLRIESAVLHLGTTDIQLCHVMYHSDGRLACTVVEWADHIYLRSGNAFPWPSRVLERVGAFSASEQPAPSKPRGLSYEETYPIPTAQQLQAWNVRRIGAGVFQPFEAGVSGHIVPQALLGRTTETLGQFREAWPEMYDDDYRTGGGSAALLEAMVIIGAPAEAGDAYNFHSGIHSANRYTRRLVHTMVNVITGENLFSMTGIGCLFNLKTRKLVKTSDASIGDMTANAISQFND